MTSNLEELRRRFQPANGISRRKLEIIQHASAAFEVRDNDGLVGYAKTVQDLALILGLQFRTPEGARFHLNQIDTEPQVNRAPPVHPEESIIHQREPEPPIKTVFVDSANRILSTFPETLGPQVDSNQALDELRAQQPATATMDPAAQARARALASKALRRPTPHPGRDLDPADTYEADDLENQGDPNILFSTDPDPELG